MIQVLGIWILQRRHEREFPAILSEVDRMKQTLTGAFSGGVSINQMYLSSIATPQAANEQRVFTARAYARAVLGVVILSVRLSVCLSVTRVDCDKPK